MARLIILALLASLSLTSCLSGSKTPSAASPAAQLPPAIEKFRRKIASMNADEVLAEAIAEFGPSPRDRASGIVAPEWDIAAGVLTVTEDGPTFRTANGHTVWLIPTSNPARDNLLQNFEMTTPPDPTNYGNCTGLGSIHITKDATYRYVDYEPYPRDPGVRSKYFFMSHPEGNVEIMYSPGIGANTRLEDLGDREIARLRFVARDGEATFEGGVASTAESRFLLIVAPSFQMYSHWANYWPDGSVRSHKRFRGPLFLDLEHVP